MDFADSLMWRTLEFEKSGQMVAHRVAAGSSIHVAVADDQLFSALVGACRA